MDGRISYLVYSESKERKWIPVGEGETRIPEARPGAALTLRHMDLAHGGGVTYVTMDTPTGKPSTFKAASPQATDLFSIMVVISGGRQMSFWNGVQMVGNVNNINVMTTPTDGEARLTVNPGRHHVIGFEYPEALRHEALEGVRLPSCLAALNGARFTEPSVVDIQLARAMKTAALEAASNPFYGPAGRYYGQAKSLEILSLFLNTVDESKAPYQPRINAVERRRIWEAREILIQNIVCPPSLPQLAAMVGMNYKKLNRGFRENFGVTVHAFVADYRLETARRAMEQEGLTVAEAADRFGYSHQSNFSAAFHKKFGHRPGGGGKKGQR